MNAFLEFLRGIFVCAVAIFVAFTIVVWFIATLDTYTMTKENNILIKEMCMKNSLNVDSIISTTQNDTLNININNIK